MELTIVELKEKNISSEILQDLKDKKFIAIRIENKGNHSREYDYSLSEAMTSEEIIYACNYVIRKIIDMDLENEKS